MQACVIVADPKVRKLAESALRRLGCRTFIHNLDDINERTGQIHYAVIQVFDPDVEAPGYAIDRSCPLIQRVKDFVDAHPGCYVVAVTHKPCANDGRMATNEGRVDYWLQDASMELLEGTFAHAYLYHHAMKGIPEWARARTVNRALRKLLRSYSHHRDIRALRKMGDLREPQPAA